MRRYWQLRSVRILAVAAVLVALYAAAGFLLAPRIVRAVLTRETQKTLGVTPTLGAIHINPFLLHVEMRDFALPDASGARLAGFDRLFVALELSSLWHRALVFSDIEAEAPYVQAVIEPDGSMNLMQLHGQPASPQAAAGRAATPRIEVTRVRLSGGRLTYEDRSTPSHFAVRLEKIHFELRNFTTGADGGVFKFTGISKLGERIDWHGHLSVLPVESDGELHLIGLRAATVSAYLRDYLSNRIGFALNSGTADVDATYRFALRNAVELRLAVQHASVTDIGVGPRGAAENWLELPALTVTGATLDLAAKTIRVDDVAMTGLTLVTWLEADKSLNLMQLAGAPGAGAPAAPTSAAPAPAPPTSAAASTWHAQLRRVAIKDATLSAEDRGVRPAAKFVLAPLSLTVTGASLDLARPLDVNFDTGVDGRGRFAASGEIVPRPLGVRLAVNFQNLDLAALQPYIARLSALTLQRGRLSGAVQLHYGAGKPSMSLAGNLQIDDLRTIDDKLHDDLINWRRLEVRGLRFQLAPNRLDIARIVAHEPYARVIIEPSRTLNLQQILTMPGSRPAAAERAAPGAATPAGVAILAAVVRPATVPAAAPMPVSIRSIDVDDGRANFSDMSIRPNFSAGIGKLAGGIRGLTSKPDSRAAVDLHGEVGAYSPVSITGAVNLFAPVLHVDLAMNFRNIDLAIFNPYSGKFAGYAISKGKLTTTLHYKIDGRKLDAQHHLSIDQLEFGPKTASKDAVSLPIKLAVALLKDRHGVIDLNFPISGTLDDPRFSLGPLIGKALYKLLEKAVTAPFALLGKLLGAGPNLQFVDFPAGTAALDAQGVKKMQEVAKALTERPQLKIDVPISDVAQIDRPALATARFAAEVRAAEAAPRGGKAHAAEAGATPTLAVLTALYRREFGHAPSFPAAAAAKPNPAAPPQAAADKEAAKITYLETQLKSRIVVTDADLKMLGEQRAKALQKALLTGTSLDPARVFVVAKDDAAAHDGNVRLQLSLQ